uniref:J domain-containing protein n=1 Tax=Kalanchoe fedtschenkoi TaxID=63787 RepID=A0A7N0T6Z2_KALFE
MEAKRLLSAAEELLRNRDYAGSRARALEAMQMDPRIAGAEQVIAICDVFLALPAGGSGPSPSPNWYAILKLEPFTEDDDLIVEQFKNVITLLSPARYLYSHAYEAYKLVREAFRVLSCEEKKGAFDEELRRKPAEEEIRVVEDEGFYTMCPFCYWVFEYERVYVGCCLRCQNCRKGFHGLEIQWPPPEASGSSLVGFIPLGVRVDEVDENVGNRSGVNVVDISDDDDKLKPDVVSGNGDVANENENENEKDRGVAGVAQGSGVKSNARERGGRRKTVASRSKKVMGRGIPRSRIEDGRAGGGGEASSSGGAATSEVQFKEGDDDLMVCLEDL